MQNNQIMRVRKYLTRFDEILCQMADRMLSAPVTQNITIDFIRCMIPHHEAAIYMCQNLLEYTTYQPLEKIANDIIQMQTRGVEQMEEILRTTPCFINHKNDVCTYQEKYLTITKNMINRMKNSPRCASINLNFVGEMIPHHEGAIAMCENLLQYYIDPRLKAAIQNIIKEQSEGVIQLKEVQRNLCRRR